MKVNSKGVVEANGNIEEFINLSQKAQKSADNLGKGANSATGGIDNLGAKIGVTSAITTKFIGILESGLKSIAGFAKGTVQMFSHFEGIQSSLSGVLRDTQKGKEMFEDLRKFSFDTTFGVDTLADASQQLLNVGIAVDELKPSLLMLGNIAQGDTTKFQELVGIYGKILNTGKAGSMQLQQMALRGVPIQQMLKQMGVTGTASANDITKAFEKMTGAGGQFEGAMERINETIAGREGFISDTWREFLVSFAEASGIGDAYKEALTPIYDILQGIVDWLQKVNQDPFMKKIFQGAVVGIITAIVGAIVAGLIPALTTVVGLITTATGGLNLIIGAVVGLGVGLGALAWNSSLTEDAGKTYEEIKKQREELEKVDAILKGSSESKFDDLASVMHSLDYAIQHTLNEIEDFKNSDEGYGYYDDATNTYRNNFYDTERYKVLTKQLENLKNQQAFAQKLTDTAEKNLDYEKRRLEIIKQASKDYKKLLEDYGNTDYGKKQNQLKGIREDIKHYEDMLKTGRKTEAYTETLASGATVARERLIDLSSDDKSMIKRILDELYAELLKTSNEDTWQNHFKKVTGTDVTGLNGNDAVAKYMKEYADNLVKLKEEEKKRDPYNEYLKALNDSKSTKNQLNYGNTMDAYKQGQENIDTFKEIRKNLLAEKYAKGGDVFTENDNAIKRLNEAIEKEEKELQKNTSALIEDSKAKTRDDIIQQSGIMGYAKYMKSDAQEGMRGSLSNQMFGFNAEELAKYTTGALVSDFLPELVDNLNIDESTTAGKATAVGIKTLQGVMNGQNIWMALISAILSSIFGSIMDDIKKESELDELKAIKAQLEDMNKNTKDQIEYLNKVKETLETDFINRKITAGITKVNDAIITPNGQFSTHPDDYIIATKNPGGLGGGTVMKVTINNNVSNDVTATASQRVGENGMNELFVTISKKVANDMAVGSNGWDTAMAYRNQRINGRSIG